MPRRCHEQPTLPPADVGGAIALTLKDLGGGGNFDASIGRRDSTASYFENVGNASVPIFANLFGFDNQIGGI